MKPASFDYVAPDDLAGVLAALASTDDAKVLAGGQSLVPMLNFRLARPALLVDVGRVPGLAYLRRVDGALRIGATTTHRAIEESPLVREHWPLLSQAARHIGHPQIRNVGTVGGSLAHADPAAELPAAMIALDATMTVSSAAGTRRVAARDFFTGYLQTVLAADELLTEIVVPATVGRSGSCFAEVARRHGDFALAGAAVRVTLSGAGRCESAAVVLLGAAAVPVRAHDAEDRLTGSSLTGPDVGAAAEAAAAGVTPTGDMHGSGEYRRHLLRALVEHCVAGAAEHARGEGLT
jgi:CO/xanthine dehydrogenase FAD-binding subunit